MCRRSFELTTAAWDSLSIAIALVRDLIVSSSFARCTHGGIALLSSIVGTEHVRNLRTRVHVGVSLPVDDEILLLQ